MKKLVTLIMGAGLAFGAMGAASADQVPTPLGTATVNEGGYAVVLDGNADNPDPGDGFISVSDGGQVCSDDNGTADDGNPDNGAESESPTCNP